MAFNQKEQQIIQWGQDNGKSSQETREAILRFRDTGSPALPGSEIKEKGVFRRVIEDIPSDVIETAKSLKKVVDVGVERQQDIVQAEKSGEQGAFRTFLQQIGTGAGTVGSAIGEAFTGALKLVTTPELEKILFQTYRNQQPYHCCL